MQPPYHIGISECLTGAKVRYDGAGKRSAYPHEALDAVFVLHPICPEVGIGLSVPRPAIQLVRTPKGTRALGVADKNLDVTDQLERFALETIRRSKSWCGFVFMERSPSCGLRGTRVHTEQGEVVMGVARGIFARVFIASHPYLPCVEAQELWDKDKRNRFVERVTIFAHWQELVSSGLDPSGVQKFCDQYQHCIASKLLPENPLDQLMTVLNQE